MILWVIENWWEISTSIQYLSPFTKLKSLCGYIKRWFINDNSVVLHFFSGSSLNVNQFTFLKNLFTFKCFFWGERAY